MVMQNCGSEEGTNKGPEKWGLRRGEEKAVKGRFPTVSSKGSRERRGSEKCRKGDEKRPTVEPKSDLVDLWSLARLGSVLEACWSILEVSSSVLKPSAPFWQLIWPRKFRQRFAEKSKHTVLQQREQQF